RALTALHKFQRRESSAAELLDALQQAAHAGYHGPAVDHFHQLAQVLQHKQPTPDELRALVAERAAAEAVVRRNYFIVALEQAVRRLSAADALALLREWSRLDWLASDPLRTAVARQLLRLILLVRRETPDAPCDEALADVERLSPGDVATALLRSLLSSEAPGEATDGNVPAAQL